MTNQGENPGDDINQLLLRLLGAFAHVQLMIDDILAKQFFEQRVPKAADFLMERVVSRIRDVERTKLVHAVAAECDSPAELDSFGQVYMDVKHLRDKVGHAARVEADDNGVLHITDSYLATKPVGAGWEVSLFADASGRLGLLTSEPLPLSAPRVGECEVHVLSHLLIARCPSDVELKCGFARRKHGHEPRVRVMNDGWPGRPDGTARLLLWDDLSDDHRVPTLEL